MFKFILLTNWLPFDFDNPLVKITGATLSIVPVIAIVWRIIKYLMRNLILDNFDIKLLHKTNHTAINLTKKISLILVGSFSFFLIDLYFYFVFTMLEHIKSSVLWIILIFGILYFLGLCGFIIYQCFRLAKKIRSLLPLILERKIQRLLIRVRQNPFLKKINYIFHKLKIIACIKNIVANFSIIFLMGTTLLFIVIGSVYINLNLELSEPSTKEILMLFFLCITPPIIIFFYKPRRTTHFVLEEVCHSLPDRYELELDYFVNDTTSVLIDRTHNVRVIKRNYDSQFVLEIYKIVDEPIRELI